MVFCKHGQDVVGIEAVEVVDENGRLVEPLAVELAPHALGPAGVADGEVEPLRVHAVPVLGGDEMPQGIFVAVGRGLGIAGGAGGKEHQHQVLPLRRVLGAGEGGAEHGVLAVEVVPPLPAAVDQNFGHPGTDRRRGLLHVLRHLIVSGGHHSGDAGGLEPVLQIVGEHLVGRQQRHSPQLVEAHHGDPELVVPLQDQQHPVPPPDAQTLKIVGRPIAGP